MMGKNVINELGKNVINELKLPCATTEDDCRLKFHASRCLYDDNIQPGPKVMKVKFMRNIAEHEILTANKYCYCSK